MATQHTPGPWQARIDQGTDDFCIEKEAFEACRIAACHDIKTAQENRANASLIAAALDLLEACDDLEQTARHVADITHARSIGMDDPLLAAQLSDLYARANAARAAVSKAKGECVEPVPCGTVADTRQCRDRKGRG